jgi:hypothetical protein
MEFIPFAIPWQRGRCSLTGYAEIGFLLVAVVGVIGLFWERIAAGRGLGSSSLRNLTVVLFFPTVAVLALEKVIVGEAVVGLLSAVAGYLLGTFSKNDAPTAAEHQRQAESRRRARWRPVCGICSASG